MNPFSGFLQPPTQRSPLAGAAELVNDVARLNLARQAQAQDIANSKDSSARDWKRIGLQEAAQQRNFSDADKKEVESLLAEYQDAEDQGDPVRLDRAAQMLKRFGMDVSPGQAKAPPRLPGQLLPDLSVFTSGKPDLQAFTGQPLDPNDPIQVELRTREAMRARAGEPELSQSDFEEQLINDTQSAGATSGAEPDIAGHLRSVAPLKALKLNTPEEQEASVKALPGSLLPPVDMGDVDSPEFQAAAAKEQPTDLGDVDSPEFQQAAQRESGVKQPPSLPGQLLPTVISKNGKQLYSSTGPSGRRSAMVQSVFGPFTSHENPQIAAAATAAQEYAEKLINVDGVSPKEAIDMASKKMDVISGQTLGLERTKLGTRPRFGGGGGTGLMGKTQDIAESAQLYDDNARAEAAKIQEEDRQYESIEAAANSGDPALQRDAVNQLLKIRSGSAVTASEDARISQINGLIAQVQDRFGRWTGGSMTPEMQNTIRQIVAIKRQVSQDKIRRIYEHQAELYEVQNRGKTKDPNVLKERADVVRKGGKLNAPDNSDLYE